MNTLDHLVCPTCNNHHFIAKYEATYIYSYTIDSDALGTENTNEFLPFLFDNREQKRTKQYIQCTHCGAQYPCSFSENNKGIDFTIIQKAVRADHVTTPDFFG